MTSYQGDDQLTQDVEDWNDPEEGAWDNFPIDTLLIRNETRTVHDVVRRIDQGQYIMNPDFQRDFVWPVVKQSKLIESMIMRIPLPVFYLAEDRQGRMIVVDGLQRLTTFSNFINNKLTLRLPGQDDLHGKRFNGLSIKLQNRIEDCNLILYIIDSQVPERARLDIFQRVNSGEPLTRQQMRNSLYNGEATKWLKREASQQIFLDATGKSLSARTMRDREFINRYCAFALAGRGDIADYNGDMDGFLGSALQKLNNLEPSDYSWLTRRLRRSLRNNLTVFKEHAFRKIPNDSNRRSVINAALWDVMSIGLSEYSEAKVAANSDIIKDAMDQLMEDDSTFMDSISAGSNSPTYIGYRMRTIQSLLSGVLDV